MRARFKSSCALDAILEDPPSLAAKNFLQLHAGHVDRCTPWVLGANNNAVALQDASDVLEPIEGALTSGIGSERVRTRELEASSMVIEVQEFATLPPASGAGIVIKLAV